MTTDSSRAGFEFAVCYIRSQNDRALFASATAALAELAKIDADQPPVTAAAKPTTDLIPLELIPAGRFLMGSPEYEPGRSKPEGPHHEVTLAAFWMASYYTNASLYNSHRITVAIGSHNIHIITNKCTAVIEIHPFVNT